jgi:hypothetical protein
MFNPYSFENASKYKAPIQIDLDKAVEDFIATGGEIQVIKMGVTAYDLGFAVEDKKAAHKKTAVSYNPKRLAKAEATMKIVKQGALEGLSNVQIAELAGVSRNYVSGLICKHKLRPAKPDADIK